MRKFICLTLIIVCTVTIPAHARDKVDVVWLTNGDRVTGEIVQLQHGKLQLDTESIGDVRIEWNDISRIESEFQFQFERTDGTRITGTIEKSSDQEELTVIGEFETISFAHENVVRISQIEDTFWEGLQGSLTMGYSFTKASDVAQGNLGFRATHRNEIRSWTIDGSTIITSDQADENTQRSNLSLSTTRFRNNRWFNSYLLGFESNDELGLNLRSSLGAGVGRYLVQTNTSELSVMGGLLGTAENLNPEDDGDPTTRSTSSQESVEGMFGVDYSRYIFDDPTVDLSVSLFAFPSITQSGRTRAQFDVNLRWELINDLFWDLAYYNTYDSDPPSGSLSTNDYGIVTSVGYSF
jgi:uncharacterized protein DUF481